MLNGLGMDHVAWLLVAANNFLRQQRADRAVVLLELLSLLDPQNAAGQRMLAYAYLLQDNRPRCRETLERIAKERLPSKDLDVFEAMSARLGGDSVKKQSGAGAE